MPRASRVFQRVRVFVVGVVPLCVLMLAAGCGDDGLGKRYPVSGKVTYKGEPVASASIAFYPAGDQTGEQRGATGVVTDGYYSLSTQGGDDGAFPGEYIVSIAARSPDLTAAKANAKAAKLGGLLRQEDVAKAYAKAKSSIPRKYESPDAGLKAKVEASRNSFDFDLVD